MSGMKELLEAGANWKFLSLLFRRPSHEVALAAQGLLEEVEPALRADACAVATLLADSCSEAAYHAVLGSGGHVSPYESDYQNDGVRDKGVIIADVAAFYRAFGFETSKEMRDVPDHVAIELAFVSYLKLKQAFALMDENYGAVEICREAEEKFLSEHVLTWLRRFLERVREHAANDFYEKAARMAERFLAGKEGVASATRDPEGFSP